MIAIAQISPIVSGADALIRGGEVDERLEIETAGGVCDQLARERVDARVSGERTVGELRQLEVVLSRKVLANLADLILDDVMVVAQPVFRADCRRVLRDGRRSGIDTHRRGPARHRPGEAAAAGFERPGRARLGTARRAPAHDVRAGPGRRAQAAMRSFVRQGTGG